MRREAKTQLCVMTNSAYAYVAAFSLPTQPARLANHVSTERGPPRGYVDAQPGSFMAVTLFAAIKGQASAVATITAATRWLRGVRNVSA